MGEAVFDGVGVALVTLFDERGDLDAEATALHAARLVERGVRAVVVAGSTGEAAALTPDERLELLRTVRSALSATVPVIAGTGAPSARQAAALTAAAADQGADAALVLSPPGVADARPYYRAVAEAAAGMPLLAYHFPAVSPPGLPVDVLDELPVAGLKDSSGDPDRLLAELEAYGGALYVGSSAVLALAGPLGCTGAVLALANLDPERCVAAFAGDATSQRQLAASHLAAKRDFPAGLKRLLADAYGTSPVARMG
ncbi:MAG TPA: dihydrodipicolinate synthase family protein [Egibacteraceae bacterium]|nr:dihydrodipicolinate synthase family protein [Egibacteraceae bacterium]